LPFAARLAAGCATATWAGWKGTKAGGAQFSEAEVQRNTPLGALTLVGRLDRIDQLADGERMVMDYKTESDSPPPPTA
jgi:ATP-dependent helicase/nuclease subunit B